MELLPLGPGAREEIIPLYHRGFVPGAYVDKCSAFVAYGLPGLIIPLPPLKQVRNCQRYTVVGSLSSLLDTLLGSSRGRSPRDTAGSTGCTAELAAKLLALTVTCLLSDGMTDHGGSIPSKSEQ